MTKACPFYIGSDTSKKLYPQLLVLVHHTVPFTKMILQNWTEAQPPSFLSTPAGLKIETLDQKLCHKWLGCMLSMPTVIKKRHDFDLAASKAFFCHRETLCDRNVSIGKRLRYFDVVISPVAVFAAGHRTMYKTDLRKFDVLFRKLLRSIVGPPAGMDWTRPWHEIIVHDWNGRVNEFVALHGIKLWSERCVQQYWELAHYISSLEDQRWVKRLMQWQPDGRGRGGRPAHLWHTFLHERTTEMRATGLHLGNSTAKILDLERL